jgi:hypothetical protein
MNDNVNHPEHYTSGDIECIDAIRAALGDKFEGFLIGNVFKYCWRHDHKNGLEDLKKAQWYLQKAIDEKEKTKKYADMVREKLPEGVSIALLKSNEWKPSNQ